MKKTQLDDRKNRPSQEKTLADRPAEKEFKDET
jgi:hypothetical protein